MRPYLEKPFTKVGLVEWLKVKALSSNPSTATTTKKIIKERKKKPLWAQPKALVPGQPCHLLGQTPKPFCAIVSPPMTGNNNSTYLRKSRIVVLKM
jgi:hypothetical protein